MEFDFDKRVGMRIKQLRAERNLTQEMLAARMQVAGCDMTRSALAKIEAGQRHIYLSEIKAFKQVLRVDYEDLLGG
jgi:Uncharacterized protein conserved in bacteria